MPLFRETRGLQHLPPVEGGGTGCPPRPSVRQRTSNRPRCRRPRSSPPAPLKIMSRNRSSFHPVRREPPFHAGVGRGAAGRRNRSLQAAITATVATDALGRTRGAGRGVGRKNSRLYKKSRPVGALVRRGGVPKRAGPHSGDRSLGKLSPLGTALSIASTVPIAFGVHFFHGRHRARRKGSPAKPLYQPIGGHSTFHHPVVKPGWRGQEHHRPIKAEGNGRHFRQLTLSRNPQSLAAAVPPARARAPAFSNARRFAAARAG